MSDSVDSEIVYLFGKPYNRKKLTEQLQKKLDDREVERQRQQRIREQEMNEQQKEQ